MMPNRYETHGPTLIRLGYDITPVVGKRPVLTGWTDRPETAHDCAAHGDKSIGVLLGGRHNLVAVDVDVLNPFCANELEKLITDELGNAPKRIGLSPKFLMVFRCTELQRKWKTGIYEMGDADGAVELLGEGQQFVASGIHVDTKRKYFWPNDNLTVYRPEELTEITPDAIRRFLARASSIMSAYGPLKGRVSDRAAQPRGGLNLKELTAPAVDIKLALDHIPNNDEHYDDWVQTAHAIKGALGDDGFGMFCEWSARSNKDDTAQNERLWRSIGTVTSVGAGSIFHWAAEYGFDGEEAFEGPPATEISATPLGIIDPRKIPLRPWLFGDQLLTGYVSAFVAPPGVGKSTMTIQMALAVATGNNFADFQCHKKGNVWLFNNEDDREELHRRIAAAADALDISLKDIAKTVFLDTGDERALLVARPGKNETVIQTPDIDACIRHIKRHNIKLFVVDPFAETHTVNENSNDDIKQVAGMYRRIAKAAQCAVLLVHHTRKGNGDGAAGDRDAARGAGAFLGVCRVVSTMFPMSKQDAELTGVQEDKRHLYVRFDGAKANLSLITHKARWFERISVDLENALTGGGDKMGVLMPWEPPSPFDGVSPEDIRAIQVEVHNRADENNAYRPTARSGDNWVGHAIADQCGLDADEDRKRISVMFKTWVANKCFHIAPVRTKHREMKPGVLVKNWVEI